MAPLEALTEVTAARIGPAHGAHTKPRAPPTAEPGDEAVAARLGPKRASRDSGAWTRSASSGISRTAPKTSSTTIASVRAAPAASPTPLTSWASATIAIVNVTARPEDDSERAAAAAGGARREQRGEDREHAGRDRRAGAGDEGEQQENDHCLD